MILLPFQILYMIPSVNRLSYIWNIKRWPPALIPMPVYKIYKQNQFGIINTEANTNRLAGYNSWLLSNQKVANYKLHRQHASKPAFYVTFSAINQNKTGQTMKEDKLKIISLPVINQKDNLPSKTSLKSKTITSPERLYYNLHGAKNKSEINIVEPLEQVAVNSNSERVTTTDLILEPSATSIAGPYGKAVATPISRALLKRGFNTNIHFRPSSVAVVGPGGIAHAEADLNIDYIDE